jgi:hypothetical protein
MSGAENEVEEEVHWLRSLSHTKVARQRVQTAGDF